MEERTRRRDILIDDEAVVDFYDRRLPATVTDVRAFEKWWKDASATQPDLLTMTRAALLDEDDEPEADPDAYPAEWVAGDQTVPARVPVRAGCRRRRRHRRDPARSARARRAGRVQLARARPPRGAGDRAAQVAAEGDPQERGARRRLGAQAAAALVEERADGTRLEAALAEAIRRETYTPTSPDDFDLDRVPAHLRMTFAAIDDRGTRLGTSKDLAELQARFAERTRTSVAKATTASGPDRSLERTGITTWDVGDIPEVVESAVGAGTVRGYPALVDEGASVALRVFATAAEQAAAHPRGVRRLLALTVPSPLGYVNDHLTQAEKLLLAASPYPSNAALLDDALLAVLDEQLAGRAPFTRSEFEALRVEVSAGLMDALFGLVAQVAKVIDALASRRPRDLGRLIPRLHVPARRRPRATRGAGVPGFRARRGPRPAPHAGLPRRHHAPRRAPRRQPRTRPPVADRGRAGDAALPRRGWHTAARSRRRPAPGTRRAGCSRSCACRSSPSTSAPPVR